MTWPPLNPSAQYELCSLLELYLALFIFNFFDFCMVMEKCFLLLLLFPLGQTAVEEQLVYTSGIDFSVLQCVNTKKVNNYDIYKLI